MARPARPSVLVAWRNQFTTYSRASSNQDPVLSLLVHARRTLPTPCTLHLVRTPGSAVGRLPAYAAPAAAGRAGGLWDGSAIHPVRELLLAAAGCWLLQADTVCGLLPMHTCCPRAAAAAFCWPLTTFPGAAL